MALSLPPKEDWHTVPFVAILIEPNEDVEDYEAYLDELMSHVHLGAIFGEFEPKENLGSACDVSEHAIFMVFGDKTRFDLDGIVSAFRNQE